MGVRLSGMWMGLVAALLIWPGSEEGAYGAQALDAPPTFRLPKTSSLAESDREKHRRSYVKALQNQKNGAFDKAEAQLRDLQSHYDDMAPRIAMDRCLIAVKGREFERALTLANAVRAMEGIAEGGQGSVSAWALLCEGEALLKLGRLHEAKTSLTAAEATPARGGPHLARIQFRLGEVLQGLGDDKGAYQIWIGAQALSDDNLFAQLAGQRAESLLPQLGTWARQYRGEMQVQRLNEKLEAGYHTQVVDGIMALIPQLQSAELRAEALVLEARARARLESDDEAIRRLMPLTYRAHLSEGTYWQLVRDLQGHFSKKGQRQSRLDIVNRYIATFPDGAHTPNALNLLAHIFDRAKRFDEADATRQKLIALAPQSTLADEARWKRARRRIFDGHYAAAFPILKDLVDVLPVHSQAHARALYWLARSAERGERQFLGWWLLEETARLYPDHYYGIMASDALNASAEGLVFAQGERPVNALYYAGARSASADGHYFDPQDSTWALARRLLFQTYDESGAEIQSPRVRRALGRALDFLSVGQRHLARVELADLRADPQARGLPLLMVSAAYHSVGQFQRGMRVGHEYLMSSTEESAHGIRTLAWALAYPFPFFDHFYREGWRYGLQPALLAAMAQQESGFWPTARSSAGARGLLQLLPRTARKMAAKDGIPQPTLPHLYQPTINVRLGALYLRDMLRLFNGSIVKALAAYNAGPGAVQRWGRQLGDVPDDVFVEGIAYDETHDYVQKVSRNIAGYMATYPALLLNSETVMIAKETPTSPVMRASAAQKAARVKSTPKRAKTPEKQAVQPVKAERGHAKGLVGPGGMLRWD